MTRAASPLPGHRHHRTAEPMPPALRLPLPPHASSLSPNVWDSRPAPTHESARRPEAHEPAALLRVQGSRARWCIAALHLASAISSCPQPRACASLPESEGLRQ